jgi:hypothetical protein
MYEYHIFNSHHPQAVVFVIEQGNFMVLYELFFIANANTG